MRLFNRRTPLNKIYNQLLFFASAAKHLLTHKYDLIVLQTNPPLSVCLLSFILCLKNLPYVIYCMDVYPDVAFAQLSRFTLLYKLLNYIYYKFYFNARRIIAISSCMKQRLASKVSLLIYLSKIWCSSSSFSTFFVEHYPFTI